MKNTLKETSAAHERMVFMLNENLEKAHRENKDLRKAQDHEKKKQMMMQVGLAIPGAVGMMGPAMLGMCSIL